MLQLVAGITLMLVGTAVLFAWIQNRTGLDGQRSPAEVGMETPPSTVRADS
ncbi:MAG: hypothetical protein HC881_15350 [Leptolyngbyaceae cyanobacterium SL_7_1]|nr:hypothetical protein [Leptolyngbyaceae cyanobacterium SL_7_1]